MYKLKKPSELIWQENFHRHRHEIRICGNSKLSIFYSATSPRLEKLASNTHYTSHFSCSFLPSFLHHRHHHASSLCEWKLLITHAELTGPSWTSLPVLAGAKRFRKTRPRRRRLGLPVTQELLLFLSSNEEDGPLSGPRARLIDVAFPSKHLEI